MSFIDYVHIVTEFLVLIRTSPKFARTRVRNFKISIWISVITLTSHDPDKVTSHDPDQVTCNFSDRVLNTTEKSLLNKGLNFLLNCFIGMWILWKFLIWIKSSSYVDFLEVSNVDKEFIKSRLRDSAFSSYKDTGKTLEKNLPKEEFDALKILLKNKDIIVQKADKGNTVVILNRKDYVCKMKNINDKSKFQKVYTDHDKILSHLIHMENRVADVLKNLRDKKEISIEQYKDLSPSCSRFGIMYGSAKVHKKQLLYARNYV